MAQEFKHILNNDHKEQRHPTVFAAEFKLVRSYLESQWLRSGVNNSNIFSENDLLSWICDDMQFGREAPIFQGNMLPPPSGC